METLLAVLLVIICSPVILLLAFVLVVLIIGIICFVFCLPAYLLAFVIELVEIKKTKSKKNEISPFHHYQSLVAVRRAAQQASRDRDVESQLQICND